MPYPSVLSNKNERFFSKNVYETIASKFATLQKLLLINIILSIPILSIKKKGQLNLLVFC